MKIKALVATPQLVLCEPNRFRAFIDRVEAAISLPAYRAASGEDPSDDEPADIEDDFYAAIYPPRPSMQVDEATGLAVIPVIGLITKGLSVFEQRYFGCADVDTIAAMVDAVAANPKITRVLFYFNTPGGYITGLQELGEKVAVLTAAPGKTTFGYADDLCASAGYWLMAMCGTIAAAPSSAIGSIGVYCTYVDYSGMVEKAGIKVQLFASGTYKGMGTPGTSLTKEQADFIQADIDRAAVKFKSTVTSMRPAITDSTMQGQCFDGDEAVGVHLVDTLVPSLAAMMGRV